MIFYDIFYELKNCIFWFMLFYDDFDDFIYNQIYDFFEFEFCISSACKFSWFQIAFE